MPVKPQFEWEQTEEDVLLHISIKGYRRDVVDVFIADIFVKVNAPPQYLLALDLLNAIDPDTSTYYFVDESNGVTLHLRLRKTESGSVWDALCVNPATFGRTALLQRRQDAMHRAEERYRKLLESRAAQKEVEKRRLLEAQWDVEKEQRTRIEQRVKVEKDSAETELYEWEASLQQQVTPSPAVVSSALPTVDEGSSSSPVSSSHAVAAPRTPADIATKGPQPAPKERMPAVRRGETVNISIDFTPKTLTMPTRSRGDEEYYRQSRYKPVSISDSPMFWKERADKHYRAGEWKASADAYSESIKRDGVFLTCVMNRAACRLQLAEYKKAIEDCSLALTLLSNTPASEVSQERYRMLMTKIHARRGAAYCWNHDLELGVADLRMAAAYRDAVEDDDVATDLAMVEAVMKEQGVTEAAADPLSARLQEAAGLFYKGDNAAAAAVYESILSEDPSHVKARCNYTVVLLSQARFKQALECCEAVIATCQEVAAVLEQPGGLATEQADSDDEEEEEEGRGEVTLSSSQYEQVKSQREMRKRISERSNHVYLLLKAYVRGAAALCGLKDYHKAHFLLEKALRITPFDNDLRDDCNRIAEKIRMNMLVAASGSGTLRKPTSPPLAATAA